MITPKEIKKIEVILNDEFNSKIENLIDSLRQVNCSQISINKENGNKVIEMFDTNGMKQRFINGVYDDFR